MALTVAYRALRSRRKFVNMPEVKKQLEQVLEREVKPELIKRFERVTVNWEHKVDFRGRKFVNTKRIMVRIFAAGPNKKIWRYVSLGTRPHTIKATRAPFLVFNTGGPGSYKPKTKPVGKFGGPGIVVGGSTVRARKVKHPGTKARQFEKAIRADYKREYSRVMENAFRRIIRRL